MFETNAEIGTMVEILVDACHPLKRGEILGRDAIQSVIGDEPNTGRWQHVMNRVRRFVERERGISMMPVENVGYALLTVQEQLDLSEYRQRRASRQIRRGERSLKALDGAKGLTMHQKRLRSVALESLRNSRLRIAHEIKAVRALGRATPTLPWRGKTAQKPAEAMAVRD